MLIMNLIDYNNCPKVSAVYAIVHTATNKRYIGSSIDIKNRIRGHVSKLRYGHHYNELLQTDFDRDGIEAFEIEVIEETTSDKLKLAEHHAVSRFKSAATGYNKNFYGVRGAPSIVAGQHTIAKCITLTVEDLDYLTTINPNLSKSVRQLIKERKEQRP